jgi:hypothetical protein
MAATTDRNLLVQRDALPIIAITNSEFHVERKTERV